MSLTDPKSGVGYAFGEKLSSAHVNTVWAQQVRALDAVNGGTYALGSDVVLNGAGIFKFNHVELKSGGSSSIDHNVTVNDGKDVSWAGTSNLPKLGARTYTIGQPLVVADIPAVGWFFQTTGTAAGRWVNNDVALARSIWFVLTKLPNLTTLQKVRVFLDGDAGGVAHGGSLPATLPDVTLYGCAFTASGSVLAPTTDGPVSDASASAAAYELQHAVEVVLGLPLLITTGVHWLVRVRSETGANAAANALVVSGLEVDVAATQVGPG